MSTLELIVIALMISIIVPVLLSITGIPATPSASHHLCVFCINPSRINRFITTLLGTIVCRNYSSTRDEHDELHCTHD